MLSKMIVATGITVGLAFAMHQVVGIMATTALKASSAHLRTKEQYMHSVAMIAKTKSDAMRAARVELDNERWNPNHMTMEDCIAGNETPPCPLVRSWLEIAK